MVNLFSRVPKSRARAHTRNAMCPVHACTTACAPPAPQVWAWPPSAPRESKISWPAGGALTRAVELSWPTPCVPAESACNHILCRRTRLPNWVCDVTYFRGGKRHQWSHKYLCNPSWFSCILSVAQSAGKLWRTCGYLCEGLVDLWLWCTRNAICSLISYAPF